MQVVTKIGLKAFMFIQSLAVTGRMSPSHTKSGVHALPGSNSGPNLVLHYQEKGCWTKEKTGHPGIAYGLGSHRARCGGQLRS
jgi:hypothetical protein